MQRWNPPSAHIRWRCITTNTTPRWVWLARTGAGGAKLQVISTAGHENPLVQGLYPILVNDFWEHAYYLKYENRRADYLKSWRAVANWQEVARRFEAPKRRSDASCRKTQRNRQEAKGRGTEGGRRYAWLLTRTSRCVVGCRARDRFCFEPAIFIPLIRHMLSAATYRP